MKYLEEKREAVSHALEWVDKLQAAIIKASGLCYAYAGGRIDNHEFIKEFPKEHWNLGDPPARLRVSLPSESYPRANTIRHEIDELRYIGLKKDGRSLADKVAMIETQIEELNLYLHREYKSTFSE